MTATAPACAPFVPPLPVPRLPNVYRPPPLPPLLRHRPVALALSSAPTPPSPFNADTNVLRYISLSNNSFALRHADKTLLIDPWLYDDLIFFTPAFFRAQKPLAHSPDNDFRSFDTASVDAIVLTQALPDHAHIPTLRRLPKHIPVISTPAARSILRQLRFSNVTYTDFGHTVSPFPAVRITTLKGSLLGPPWSRPQHAYIFAFDTHHTSRPIQLYHEPHGNHDQRALSPYTRCIDVVVTPVKATKLPFGYALVNGVQNALQLCRYLSPHTLVPFDNGAVANTSGLLASLLYAEGGLDVFQRRVSQDPQLKHMQLVFPSAIGSEYVVANRNTNC